MGGLPWQFLPGGDAQSWQLTLMEYADLNKSTQGRYNDQINAMLEDIPDQAGLMLARPQAPDDEQNAIDILRAVAPVSQELFDRSLLIQQQHLAGLRRTDMILYSLILTRTLKAENASQDVMAQFIDNMEPLYTKSYGADQTVIRDNIIMTLLWAAQSGPDNARKAQTQIGNLAAIDHNIMGVSSLTTIAMRYPALAEDSIRLMLDLATDEDSVSRVSMSLHALADRQPELIYSIRETLSTLRTDHAENTALNDVLNEIDYRITHTGDPEENPAPERDPFKNDTRTITPPAP